MEGNNMNGFNMGNLPGTPGIAPQPMQPQQPPVMPTMEGASGMSSQPMPAPGPISAPPDPNLNPAPAFQPGPGPGPAPGPAFGPAPEPAQSEPIVKEFVPSNDVSSITSAIMNDRTKKKSNGGSGLAVFLFIIILMETIYIGYDFCVNHSDALNGVMNKQENNGEQLDENGDATTDQNDELTATSDIEKYPRPDNALEEYKFNLSVQGKVEEVTIRINEDKKLSYEVPSLEIVEVFDNIADVRYFAYTTLGNNLSELYVNTNDYKAYRIVFEDATGKKYESEDFFSSAVELTTENNNICNIVVDKESAISSVYESGSSYNIGATLTDGYTYKITGDAVTQDIFVKSTIKDAMDELDGIALTLDEAGKANFYSKEGTFMSKLVDENGEDIIVKEAIAVPIKDGESYRYKYYILTSDDLLCFVFNNEVKNSMDTQAKYYSTKPVTDYALVEDTTYVNDNYKKYSAVTMKFIMSTEPERLEDLRLTPIGMAAGDARNLIYVLASKKAK